MIPRPDLLGPESPEGIEVLQLTTEADVPSCHIYMEAQVFTPDSRRFLLHRSASAHGGDPHDPEHHYLVCDLDDGGSLTPLITEPGCRAPSVSPNGEWVYYFVDKTRPGGGSLALRRVRLDGGAPETLSVVDAPLPGATGHLFRTYPLSTISSDGSRLATSGLLTVAVEDNPPGCLVAFDLASGEPAVVLQGPAWTNIHPQYSRSLDPEARRDILVQENHGGQFDAEGKRVRLTGGKGADIHVIRDDGSDFRDMPWGRDGREFCQGHQCWRGRTPRAITSASLRPEGHAPLIEGVAAPHAGHLGLATPGGQRNDLTREIESPSYYHFATDIAGRRIISDARLPEPGGSLVIADLPEADDAPLANLVTLLNPGSSWTKEAHIHPFLSPDGTTGFFNSDESGILQAYMVTGLDGVF